MKDEEKDLLGSYGPRSPYGHHDHFPTSLNTQIHIGCAYPEDITNRECILQSEENDLWDHGRHMVTITIF